MKKFVCRTIPLFVLFISVEIILRMIPCDIKYKYSFVQEHGNIQILILGSSLENAAINTKYFSNTAFNAAVAGQGTEFNYLFFKSVYSELKSLKAVVFPLSFFSLHCKDLERKGPSLATTNANVYCDFGLSLRPCHNWLIANHPPKDVFTEVFRFLTEKKYTNIHSDSSGYIYNKGIYANYPENVKRGSVVTNGNANEKSYGADTIANMLRYREIIEQCERDSVLVFLISTPLTLDFLKYIDKSKVDCVRSTGNMLEQQYSNVTYVDFYYDKRFRDEDFDDANHLNYKGAEKVSFLLDSIIVEKLNRR